MKILKKRPIWPGYSRAQNLKEIRLASEAMGVPKPPHQALQQAVDLRKALDIAHEDEKTQEGEEQGVIHRPIKPPVYQKGHQGYTHQHR